MGQTTGEVIDVENLWQRFQRALWAVRLTEEIERTADPKRRAALEHSLRAVRSGRLHPLPREAEESLSIRR